MIKRIMRWFHRKPDLAQGWALQMRALMYRHTCLRFIKNDKIFEVNQHLTDLLICEEEVFLKEYGEEPDMVVKRHQLVAQQLKELRTLRDEIKEVYRDLDRNSI